MNPRTSYHTTDNNGNDNHNQLSLFEDSKKDEIRRKSRRKTPCCQADIVIERLRPDVIHHSSLHCAVCNGFLTWVKKRQSLFDEDGSRRKFKVVAVPTKERKGKAFCRVVDTSTGEIVADQCVLGEPDVWFELREGGDKDA